MESIDKNDEAYWMSAFRDGESQALEYFYKLHYKTLCYFAIRLTQDESETEDIVSECFVKIWEKRADFKTAENIKAYLYIRCRNVCLTYLRDLKRKTAAQQLYFNQLEQSGNTILHEIIEAEFLNVLDQELNFLPERCREVFNLIYFEGKKTDEIAFQLNLSVKTVRNHKARAVDQLKTAFLKKNLSGPFYLAFLLFIDGFGK
ncbi:RNA polymerase sigma factor [Pedobacter nyackensis]|uniref:RNA polymerase sigma-70 factor, ECF subfamily n=1 Tax=Pedobacter nyackensis TaxID=475255 RepID=A0A1W2EPL2_9SPHI|nr:RNA polymerase sigma-70 factor [Pedobacter nyackensis]SMD11657.1 RNA polymerase sigma-70 factor, ECF subfamily [Pedobacter nyackensis]